MIKLIKTTFFDEGTTKKKLADFILTNEIFSMGKECFRFEEEFAKFQGRKYAVLVNSGSSANLILIQALVNLGRLKKEDLVAFSSLTWATNTMPLIQLGLVPIPVDIELSTLNVSSSKLLEMIKIFKIRSLFLTNLLGFCDDIDKIEEVCRENNILLIEDNCESLGSVYKGRKLGNYSLASTCSFFVAHQLSTIEGGVIVTDDDELSDMLKMVRAHGWDRSLDPQKQKELRKENGVSDFYAKFALYNLSYNVRPTELTGFLGNVQLPLLEGANKKREENFKKIAEKVYKNTDKYYPIKYEHLDFVSNFSFPVITKTKVGFEELLKKCEGKIEVRPIESGDMTQQPFYKTYSQMQGFSINHPNASIVHEQGLFIGNNPDLTEKEIETIIQTLR